MANLAPERPLVLLVDDAQWSDPESLMFLGYLGRPVRPTPASSGFGDDYSITADQVAAT